MSATPFPRRWRVSGAAGQFLQHIAEQLTNACGSSAQPTVCRCPANQMAYEQILAALDAVIGLDADGCAVARIELGQAQPLIVLIDAPRPGIVRGEHEAVTVYGAQVDRVQRGRYRACDVEWAP